MRTFGGSHRLFNRSDRAGVLRRMVHMRRSHGIATLPARRVKYARRRMFEGASAAGVVTVSHSLTSLPRRRPLRHQAAR
jgi:hypothetical protein